MARIFALYCLRPDKRDPLINWFSTMVAAQRSAVALSNLTLKDYGHEEQLLAQRGFKRGLAYLHDVTGEKRVRVEVACLDVPQSKLAGLTINERPKRYTVWERAKPDDITLFGSAPRTHVAATGVEKYLARRKEAAFNNFLYEQKSKTK